MNCSLHSKVKTTPDWKAEHSAHLGVGQSWTFKTFDGPHENWYWIVCPCGAEHLTSIERSA